MRKVGKKNEFSKKTKCAFSKVSVSLTWAFVSFAFFLSFIVRFSAFAATLEHLKKIFQKKDVKIYRKKKKKKKRKTLFFVFVLFLLKIVRITRTLRARCCSWKLDLEHTKDSAKFLDILQFECFFFLDFDLKFWFSWRRFVRWMLFSWDCVLLGFCYLVGAATHSPSRNWKKNEKKTLSDAVDHTNRMVLNDTKRLNGPTIHGRLYSSGSQPVDTDTDSDSDSDSAHTHTCIYI